MRVYSNVIQRVSNQTKRMLWRGISNVPYEPENKKGAVDIKIVLSDLSSGFHKKYNKE